MSIDDLHNELNSDEENSSEYREPIIDDLIEDLSEVKYNDKVAGCFNIIFFVDGSSVFNIYDRSEDGAITSPEVIIGALSIAKNQLIQEVINMREDKNIDE